MKYVMKEFMQHQCYKGIGRRKQAGNFPHQFPVAGGGDLRQCACTDIRPQCYVTVMKSESKREVHLGLHGFFVSLHVELRRQQLQFLVRLL